MTFTLPSDTDPDPGSSPSAPSSPPDFLAQLTAAQQADAHGRELSASASGPAGGWSNAPLASGATR